MGKFNLISNSLLPSLWINSLEVNPSLEWFIGTMMSSMIQMTLVGFGLARNFIEILASYRSSGISTVFGAACSTGLKVRSK
eukprot:13431.XXX_821871_822113_1 [CDS] Oithona nana genome sequencing.